MSTVNDARHWELGSVPANYCFEFQKSEGVDLARLDFVVGLAACAVVTSIIMIPILGIIPLFVTVGMVLLVVKST